MNAIARMEYLGIPIDVPTFEWLKEHRLEVRDHLIEQGDREYNVFDGTKLTRADSANTLQNNNF